MRSKKSRLGAGDAEPRGHTITDYATRVAPPPAVEQGQHRVYGPRVIEIAHFLVGQIGADVLELMIEIDRRWPDLSVRDLVGALVLAEALAMEPRGSA
jgi:hypothetical protein